MLNFYNKKVCSFYVVLVCFILSTSQSYAQCAGTSNTVSVCEKEQDPTNQAYDLFLQLNGNPVPGGIWQSDDPFNNDALNETTGILNLWGINISGEHSFTYSFPSCDTSTAAVTIQLGGYSGENNVDGGANACQGDIVNLFSFLDSVSPELDSDINGDWEEVPAGATGGLSQEFFDTNGLTPGNYTFDYTVPAIGSCPARTSRVIVEIHRLPVSGTPIPIGLCETEDLSIYTNVDLFDHLVNEDANGQWFDDVDSGQITFATDHHINLQELYDTNGPGVYSYTYRVVSQQGVCPDQQTSVEVVIEEKFILNGSISVDDFCVDEGPAVVLINYDDSLLNEGFYLIEGTLTGGVNTTFSEYATLTNGVGNFELQEPFPTNVDIIVTITDIGPHIFCTSDVGMIEDSFKVIDIVMPLIQVNNICFNDDPIVVLSNVVNASVSDPSNESYSINYTLTSPSGSIQNLTSPEINFNNGTGNFAIDSVLILETGLYTVNIEDPFNFTVPCAINAISDTFTVNSRPDSIVLDLIIDNPCVATTLQVIINAPYLTSGQYTVTYTVTELNQSIELITNTIVFSGGTANYDVSISNLPQGNYVVRIHSIQTDSTPCREIFEFEVIENFSIQGIPDAPILDAQQSFCLESYLPDVPTINDIVIISGNGLVWHETATSTTPLDVNTPLINGEEYFVSGTDPINNCYSSDRSSVQVTLSETSIVIVDSETPIFCVETAPTLNDLNVQTQNGGGVIWYDAPNGGNMIDPTSMIVNGMTYYAGEQINACVSNTLISITPQIITIPNPEVDDFAGNLCIIDAPTIADIEKNVFISGPYNLNWFANLTSDVILERSQMAEPGTYYVCGFDPINGCESDRVPVSVTLDNCSPETFESFIPDGFSPNNDGVNDVYNLVNFNIIFPDYSISIYNRYGKILFEGNTSTGPWDGVSSKGSLGKGIMPTGVYFYVIEFNKLDLPPKQGRLYLSR
ncbi:gliding motility-associated C-terminal domain-containing protein [Ulvibacter antarcticus]|uniref:Gliding motility-associated-like protein n=1 Tax=Ulvibacter antarcticus TaxID=442714 RepID=A0A3L9YY16_9FLAO|nr:gliding motility-associated C-terminal domain-containing protein [Ulvibacter antarcticus]RMA64720.1 gliding motility-associated-like protein [Ulvibacter antarcticus]